MGRRPAHTRHRRLWVALSLLACASCAFKPPTGDGTAGNDVAPPPGEAESLESVPEADDGWPDVSEFLGKKYGFLPIAVPITEPAVGYGAGGGLMFLSKPLGEAKAGHGRPNISFVGGFGTENGSWGVAGGDVRHWLDDRLQTIAGLFDASVNLDFHGIGETDLDDDPLRYNLHPVGGLVQGKYRLGAESTLWAGIAYAFATTEVEFEAPTGTPGLPEFQRTTDVGGVTPSFTWDTRNNIFTPTSGTYVEGTFGIFAPLLGADSEFQRARVLAMQYVPLGPRVFLGMRGDVAAAIGDAPFYLEPFINLRGVPVMRYQGEEIAQLEVELRWQCWKRISVVGFAGAGAAWNDYERFDDTQSVVAGGGGFRYELAREYGIHVGVDVAFSDDNTAFYLQIGSAWSRP